MSSTILNNRYRVIRTLGSGGFGETFLAEDTYMPSARRCVVKLLKPITNNPQVYQLVKERFAREAAILEALGQSNQQIPSLYAYFEEAGQFYLVQEWIEGITLTNWVQQQGKIREDYVKQILIKILPVLDYVHSKGIVHRDIKPDNLILRNSDKLPVLIDFGAVRETMGTMVNSQGNPTSSIVIGTPGFMPSEQAAGRPVYSSDLYALGLVSIYLLTGRQPQELETDSHTGEIIWHPYATNISPQLITVLDRAIMSHPRDRIPSAQAMLDELHSNPTPFELTVPVSQPTPKVSPTPSESVTIPPTPLELPQTVQVTQPPSIPNNGKNIIFGSLIAGSLIGVSIVLGFLLSKPPQPISEQSLGQKNTSPSLDEELLETNTPPTSTPEIKPIPHLKVSQDYYFLADSAFADNSSAEAKMNKLKADGYNDAGLFWIPDYPNLSGKPLFKVYAAKFSDRNNCANFLREYSKFHPGVYCLFASQNPKKARDRFYSDYAWVSQIRITDAHLEGRRARELSIMRNSIFARHGRRFKSPRLRNYFKRQSWYRPKYAANKFSQSLLSDLEKRNAAYILEYQNRNNLRWIP
ncbi:MAG: YARHG domain-containing protein [Moorea sp. SIO2B7]|nr:YARHG domain-containing protein [Moorena sp. SIO2B7]